MQSNLTTPPPAAARKPAASVIDITPATNIQSLTVVVLRLTALNFLLRILVEVTTPLLVFAGIYQRPSDPPTTIAWALVVVLFAVGLLLWILAWPVARWIGRGVRNEFSLDNLSLADCYSVAFAGIGTVYLVSRLAGVWNWARYFLGWIFHGAHTPWADPTRGYQLANVFIPFIAGMVLLWKRNTWARLLAGTQTHNAVVSLKQPWGQTRGKSAEPISISMEPPGR